VDTAKPSLTNAVAVYYGFVDGAAAMNTFESRRHKLIRRTFVTSTTESCCNPATI